MADQETPSTQDGKKFGKRPRVRFYQLQLTEVNRPEYKQQQDVAPEEVG